MSEQDLIINVHYSHVGHEGKITLRGDGLGLSWGTGWPLLQISHEKWQTTLRYHPGVGHIELKPLINDHEWMLGDNIRISFPHDKLQALRVDIYPQFRHHDHQTRVEVHHVQHEQNVQPAQHEKQEQREPVQQHQGSGNTLHLGSFNLRYGTAKDGSNSWDHRKDLVLDVFRNHKFDVVGVQEALHFQLEYIVQSLSLSYVGVGRQNGSQEGEFAAIIYNPEILEPLEQETFWLSETPSVPGSTTFGNRLPRICTWARFKHKHSGKNFQFFNTHLDHESRIARDKGSALIVQKVDSRKAGEPVFITGDFNSYSPDSIEVANIKLAGFSDALNSLGNAGTFHNFSGARDGGKIDFIFVPVDAKFSGPTKILDASVIYHSQSGAFPSDHFPIRALVEFS